MRKHALIICKQQITKVSKAPIALLYWIPFKKDKAGRSVGCDGSNDCLAVQILKYPHLWMVVVYVLQGFMPCSQ